MTERCLCPEDLDGLVEGKAAPAWQNHLQSCAACRALLAEYSSFLAAEPTTGADPLAAETALDRRMPAQLRTTGKQTTSPSTVSDRWSALLNGLRWRPALATAALAAALLFVFWPQGTERFADPSGQVRGPDAIEQGFLLDIQDVGATGGWIVQWPPVEQATRYRIEILDQALSVVMTWSEDSITRIELAPETFPAHPVGPWFVRVIALADHRELARTPLRELPQRP